MLALLPLLGCNPIGPWADAGDGDTALDGPRIVASPARIDFGTVSVNEDGYAVGELTLYNAGDTPETVSGHDEPIGSDFFVVDGPPLITLDPGDELTLEVRYLPLTEQTDSAELLIEPSDETVRLLGVGAAPVIAADAPPFEDVVLGCSGTGYVAITNEGTEDLVLTDVTLDGAEYTIVSAPTTIAPGDTEAVELLVTPAGGDDRGATLRVTSNDPYRPALGVWVSTHVYGGEVVTETFRYTPSNPTDLLFVVATDGGMTAQLDKAADVIPRFVDTLRDTNIDYHLTALSGAGPCPSSTPGWADRSDTSLQTEVVLERGFDGDSGAWDGDLLGLAVEALARAASEECLVDFRREEADLHVIIVADGPSAADAMEAAEQLADRVTSPAALHVSALLPGDDSCGDEAEDYAEVVEAYGGTLQDLCAMDWEPAFDALADLPAGRGAVRYVLAEAPVPSSIEVLAEGVRFTDWSWDAAENAVRFDGDTVPALGAEISIEYVSAVACE